MKTTILSGLSILALATAGATAAQTTPEPGEAARHSRPELTRARFVDEPVARLSAMDADQDGVVTVEERRAAFEAKRAERHAARFAELDANGDGMISRAEFDAAKPMRPQRAGQAHRVDQAGGPRHAMRAQAGRAGPRGEGRAPGDHRGAGPVTISEVRARLNSRFDKLDANGDGVISAEERRAAMNERRNQRRDRASERPQQAASPAPGSE